MGVKFTKNKTENYTTQKYNLRLTRNEAIELYNRLANDCKDDLSKNMLNKLVFLLNR